MNHDAITIEDCLDMFLKKGQVAIISNGRVICFIKEDTNEKK